MTRLLELRAKVDDGSCTVQELQEYCYMAFEPRVGMWLQEADYFIQPDSMDAFNWLKGWWKLEEYPQNLPAPTLLAFLWGIYVPIRADGCGPAHSVTLNDKILEFAARARTWCEQNGVDPDKPGETPGERRRRKNRERMAEVRAHRAVPDKVLTDDSVREQVRALEARISHMKDNFKMVDEALRQEVIEAQQRMIALSSQRKERAQEHKDAIVSIQKEIHNLTAKQ